MEPNSFSDWEGIGSCIPDCLLVSKSAWIQLRWYCEIPAMPNLALTRLQREQLRWPLEIAKRHVFPSTSP